MQNEPDIRSCTTAEPPAPGLVPEPRPLIHSYKMWFLVDLPVLAAAGWLLYVLSGQTERFFAWTIGVPLTAAFLGAGYSAAMPLMYYASRQSFWAHARLAVFGVFTFTVFSLATTLLYLDKFHLSEGTATSQVVAWLWLAIYVSVPLLLLILTVLQLRIPGTEPARRALLPLWTRAVFAVQALVLVVSGVALFVAPAASFWPWQLTPLTGRAIAAWLFGLAVTAGQSAWENDFARVRGALISFGAGGVLQLFAVARFSNALQWGEPSAAVYIAFLVTMLALGAYGWLGARER